MRHGKRGKVVAKLVRATEGAQKVRYPQDTLRGTGEILGDIMSPLYTDEELQSFLDRETENLNKKPRHRRCLHTSIAILPIASSSRPRDFTAPRC